VTTPMEMPIPQSTAPPSGRPHLSSLKSEQAVHVPPHIAGDRAVRRPSHNHGLRRDNILNVPVEGGTGRAVVSPAACTLRDEMALSGQRLLAASGQIPMAAHKRPPCS
jgi:hypothetical protein